MVILSPPLQGGDKRLLVKESLLLQELLEEVLGKNFLDRQESCLSLSLVFRLDIISDMEDTQGRTI